MQGAANFAPFLPLNWLPWQRPLSYWKKNSDPSSTPKTLSYGVKIAKIARGLRFASFIHSFIRGGGWPLAVFRRAFQPTASAEA